MGITCKEARGSDRRKGSRSKEKKAIVTSRSSSSIQVKLKLKLLFLTIRRASGWSSRSSAPASSHPAFDGSSRKDSPPSSHLHYLLAKPCRPAPLDPGQTWQKLTGQAFLSRRPKRRVGCLRRNMGGVVSYLVPNARHLYCLTFAVNEIGKDKAEKWCICSL